MPSKHAHVTRQDVFFDPNVDIGEAISSILAIEWPTPTDEQQLCDFLETFAVFGREEFIAYVAQFPPNPALLWFLLSRYHSATSGRAAKGGAKRSEPYKLLRATVLEAWEKTREKWKSRTQFASVTAEANGQKVTPRQITVWIKQYEDARLAEVS